MSARREPYHHLVTTVDVTVVVQLKVRGHPEDATASAEREVLAAIERGEDTALTAKVVGSIAMGTESDEVAP